MDLLLDASLLLSVGKQTPTSEVLKTELSPTNCIRRRSFNEVHSKINRTEASEFECPRSGGKLMSSTNLDFLAAAVAVVEEEGRTEIEETSFKPARIELLKSKPRKKPAQKACMTQKAPPAAKRRKEAPPAKAESGLPFTPHSLLPRTGPMPLQATGRKVLPKKGGSSTGSPKRRKLVDHRTPAKSNNNGKAARSAPLGDNSPFPPLSSCSLSMPGLVATFHSHFLALQRQSLRGQPAAAAAVAAGNQEESGGTRDARLPFVPLPVFNPAFQKQWLLALQSQRQRQHAALAPTPPPVPASESQQKLKFAPVRSVIPFSSSSETIPAIAEPAARVSPCLPR